MEELVEGQGRAVDAECDGVGKRIWNDDHDLRLYRHFECLSDLDDGSTDDDILLVLGHFRFKLEPIY